MGRNTTATRTRTDRAQLLMEALEDRVLLSGDIYADGADAFQLQQQVFNSAYSSRQFRDLRAVSGKLVMPTKDNTGTITTATTTTAPATIVTRALSSHTQLVITGTSGNDSIVVTQSGSLLNIVANGKVTNYSVTFSEIVIDAGAGADVVTVQSSVQLPALIYAGAGNDTINALGKGRMTVVAIGGGNDIVTGNGINTSYWVDATGDTVTASAAEIAAGRVHKVASFYQPWGTSSTDAVSTELLGQDLKDPAGGTKTVKLANRSLWGVTPSMSDINQGSLGDCYFLATIQSLANNSPEKLRELAVDLGDGTYAVQFKRNGVTQYVRVDGDFAASSGGSIIYERPGSSGSVWGLVMEKAYAYFRTGANTYASLTSGWMGSVMSDFGIANTTFSVDVAAATLYSSVSAALAAGKAVTIGTNSTITGGVPLVGSHAYSVVGVTYTNGVYTYTLRNPWGIDGAGNDGVNDGLVRLTLAQLQSCVDYGAMMV